ncbi:MAG TPA: PLP-dependent cysteine synthase family protein [Devosia sp.]
MPTNPCFREWRLRAIKLMEADGRRSADSHLIPLPLAGFPGIDIYLKDESSHPTGSLKHRLARSLILYGICNGQIGPETVLVEASSGSTAVSEAYFARMLGLKFVAVLPRSTSRSKIEAIELQGATCHFVEDPAQVYQEAQRLAQCKNGHYLDQFTFAERATDWRGNNNIAESIFQQLSLERHSIPRWICMSAGTGGTSATIGRYILFKGLATQLCVPDPQHSAFFAGWTENDAEARSATPSRIEGIGRPRVEKSFVPGVVDAMIKVPDVASIAAARVLSRLLSRRVGGSTGTNLIGILWAASRMRAAGEEGSLVTLICDSGERYGDTYYNDEWLQQQRLDVTPAEAAVEIALRMGELDPALISDQSICTKC